MTHRTQLTHQAESTHATRMTHAPDRTGFTIGGRKSRARLRIAAAAARIVVIISAAILLTLLGWLGFVLIERQNQSRILIELQSADAESRRRAAARVVDAPFPAALDVIADALVRRKHEDADTRESFVHALGRVGGRAHMAAVEALIDSDPSGFVRAAAWLALARIDAEHMRTMRGADRVRSDPWDRLGVAQARLAVGDVSEAEVLMALVETGEPGQRQVASRALHKWLRPLLEAAGRWPLDADPAEGETWPRELVHRVRQECRELRLQELADAVWPRVAAAHAVHLNVKRITSARNRLARVLFDARFIPGG